MKTVLVGILGLFLTAQQCSSSPAILVSNITENTSFNISTESNKNGSIKNQSDGGVRSDTGEDLQHTIVDNQSVRTNRTDITNFSILEDEGDIIINLEEINKMSPVEFLGRQVRSLWHYLLYGKKEEKKSTFLARCAGIAKKIRQLIPLVTIGGTVMLTKLAFLVLFSLKTLGLLGLLLLINVGTAAAKLGAFLGSKKQEHTPQHLHFHVQPTKSDEHVYHSSSHLSGPPYGLGWDDRMDRIDTNIQNHELYNLYEKLRLENDLRKYFTLDRGKYQ